MVRIEGGIPHSISRPLPPATAHYRLKKCALHNDSPTPSSIRPLFDILTFGKQRPFANAASGSLPPRGAGTTIG